MMERMASGRFVYVAFTLAVAIAFSTIALFGGAIFEQNASAVVDNIPPIITCPADPNFQATSQGNVSIPGYPPATLADFLALGGTASDNLDTSLDYLYTGPSTFPVGTTFVTHQVTDDFSNAASCAYLVTVVDAAPPDVTVPADITVNNDPGQPGAIVSYNASASDDGGLASFSCAPPSGSFFPLGTTTVTCTAVDDAGNTTSRSFTVTVRQTANIDIKPGGSPNTVNVKKDQTITVALLGSATFNVNNVDASSLRFGPLNATPLIINNNQRVVFKDVNNDGRMDMISQYKLSATGIKSLANGDYLECLKGNFTGGVLFLGCDTIRVIRS